MNAKSLLAAAIVTVMMIGSLPAVFMDESNATDPWASKESSIYYKADNVTKEQMESFALEIEKDGPLQIALSMALINVGGCDITSSGLANLSFEFGNYYASGDHKRVFKTFATTKADVDFTVMADSEADSGLGLGKTVDDYMSNLAGELGSTGIADDTSFTAKGSINCRVAECYETTYFEGANDKIIEDSNVTTIYVFIDANINVKAGDNEFDVKCNIDGSLILSTINDFGETNKSKVKVGTGYERIMSIESNFKAFNYSVVAGGETKSASLDNISKTLPKIPDVVSSFNIHSVSELEIPTMNVGDGCSSETGKTQKEYADIINGLSNVSASADVGTFNSAYNAATGNNSGNNDNTLLYVGIGIVAVVIVAGIAVYFLKFKK